VDVSSSGTGDFWGIVLRLDDRTLSTVPEILTEFMRGIPTIADDINRWMSQIIRQSIGKWPFVCLPG